MIEAIRRELAARADPAKAPAMQAYMKSAMPFYGVQKAGRKEIARELFAANPLAGFDAWRSTVLALYEELIVTGAWWDFVDEVAVHLVGELDHAAVAPILREWASDEDLWKRRSAIIAQVLRKQDTDLALLYDCIEPNRGDREALRNLDRIRSP